MKIKPDIYKWNNTVTLFRSTNCLPKFVVLVESIEAYPFLDFKNLTKDYIWFQLKMTSLNEHHHFNVILCFLWTDIYVLFLHSVHFECQKFRIMIP